MDEARRKRWQEDNSFNDFHRIDILVSHWVPFDDGEETWMNFSVAQDPFENMRQIHLTYFAFRETGGYLEFKQLDDVYAM